MSESRAAAANAFWSHDERTLAGRVSRARTLARLTQAELGHMLGVTGSYISSIERQRKVPPPDQVVRLHEILSDYVPLERTDPLAAWLLLTIEADTRGNSAPAVSEVVAQSIELILHKSRRVKTELTPPFSLSDFPEAFLPLTIICGDRRESPHKTAGDLLVYSVAISDLTYLHRLGIEDRDVTIKSDKLFAIADESDLRETLGNTNLLIIGSPAVNLAARVINGCSIFRTNYPKDFTAWEQLLQSKTKGNAENGLNLNERDTLSVFEKMLRFTERKRAESDQDDRGYSLTPSELDEFYETLPQDDRLKFKNLLPVLADHMADLFPENMDPEYRMDQFRKSGLLDAADGVVRGETTRSGNDFGLISLAPHPFADPASDRELVSILVSGIHGPATTHGIRALADYDFKDHPLGGIFEVALDEQKGWPDRLEEAAWYMRTKPYKPAKIIKTLNQARANPDASAFRNLDVEQIDEMIDFVGHVSGLGGSEVVPLRPETGSARA